MSALPPGASFQSSSPSPITFPSVPTQVMDHLPARVSTTARVCAGKWIPSNWEADVTTEEPTCAWAHTPTRTIRTSRVLFMFRAPETISLQRRDPRGAYHEQCVAPMVQHGLTLCLAITMQRNDPSRASNLEAKPYWQTPRSFVVTFDAFAQPPSRTKSPACSGVFRFGIGLPANSRRQGLAMIRVQRPDHVTRALSVAIPVSAYICR